MSRFHIQPDWHLCLLAASLPLAAATSTHLSHNAFWVFDPATNAEYVVTLRLIDGAVEGTVTPKPPGSADGKPPTVPNVELLLSTNAAGSVSPAVRISEGASVGVHALFISPLLCKRGGGHAEVQAGRERTIFTKACATSLDLGARRCATGYADGSLRVWSLPVSFIGESDDEDAATAADAGSTPLTNSNAAVSKGKPHLGDGTILSIDAHLSDICGVHWFPSDKVLLTCSGDLSLKVWDASTGFCGATLSGSGAGVTGCGMVGRGRSLVSASRDGVVCVWEVPSKSQVEAWDIGAPINAMALIAPGSGASGHAAAGTSEQYSQYVAVVACDDGTVRAQPLMTDTTAVVTRVANSDLVPSPGYTTGPKCLSVACAGNRYAFVGASDALLSVFSVTATEATTANVATTDTAVTDDLATSSARHVSTPLLSAATAVVTALAVSSLTLACVSQVLVDTNGADILAVDVCALPTAGTYVGVAACADGSVHLFVYVEGGAVRICAELSGADCDAVRAVSLRLVDSLALSGVGIGSGDSSSNSISGFDVVVAAACNDGVTRLYRTPLSVLLPST